MALAALDAATRVIEGPVNKALFATGAPQERLRAMLALLRTYYEDGTLGCLIGALATADCPAAVRLKVGALARNWIGSVADFLAEAKQLEPEAAAARLIATLQGSLVVAGATGDEMYFHAALAEIDDRFGLKSLAPNLT